MLCFIFAALVVLLDQFIKHWVLIALPLYEKTALLPGVVGLTHVRNTGAAFSILANQRWLLIVIACLATLLLIAILLRYNEGFWGTLGLAAVLGGTIGNLIDRISYGYVVDIFEFQFVDFAIFNIADIFITLGGVTFLLYFIVTTVKPEKSSPLAAGVEAAEQAHPQRPQVDDHIGLYDFQYADRANGRETGEYDSYAGTDPFEGEYSENGDRMQTEAPQDYYAESDSGLTVEDVAEMSAALDALGSLEQELLDSGALDDFNLDDMLREYGFEDNAAQV